MIFFGLFIYVAYEIIRKADTKVYIFSGRHDFQQLSLMQHITNDGPSMTLVGARSLEPIVVELASLGNDFLVGIMACLRYAMLVSLLFDVRHSRSSLRLASTTS